MSGEAGEYARAFAQGAVGTAVLAIALVLIDAPPAEAVAVVAFVGLVCLGVAFGLAAAAVVLYVGATPGEELTALAQFAGAGSADGGSERSAWTTGSSDAPRESGRSSEVDEEREGENETGGFVFSDG